MKHKITLKEISKRFNVSISTVSKSLKDSSEISKKTKRVIQAYAKAHNYKPNNIALSLKNQKTKNIGVILPEIVHHFFSSVINGVEQVASEKGYNVIVCISNESFDKEVVNMQMLANGSIDGFIMSLSKGTEKKQDFFHINEVINQGMPVVMMDRVTEKVVCDKIIIDDEKSAYNAVTHLIETGCKQIALLTMPRYMSVSKLRLRGYKSALKEHKIAYNEDLVVEIDDFFGDFDAVQELLKSHKVDAVFSVTEFFAISAMKIAQKLKMKIPQAISFVGFTDGIISKSSTPELTTIRQDGEVMGVLAATKLINRLEEVVSQPFTTQVVKSNLIKRASTK